MSYPVLVAAAWPYANANIHVGNLTGSYLPADIFARFQRLQGREVIFVSGSDAHGTPITVRADSENTTPIEVYKRYHEGFIDLFLKMGLTYDLFTSTHTRNHFNVSQNMFLALKDNGFLYKDSQMHWYAPSQKRFLPDRYVEGTCYICGYDNARSDQCDNCGSLLESSKLIDPRSKIDNSVPELRETEHYYLDLGKLQDEIIKYLEGKESFWRPNVIRQSLGQIRADGLHGRPITRDLDWGIPVPLDDWQGKCLYVWFEAVIGYLSASIEWSDLNNVPEKWRQWWHDTDTKAYYFIGKDNIPFHAIIWPAELMGVGKKFDELMGCKEQEEMVIPFDVPANEFMNLEGEKISGSRNWAVWGDDFLSRYDPDPLRYYLTVNMPEAKDTDWDWEGFLKRNNEELVATWGNLVNRVLSFTNKHWEGEIPDSGELRDEDKELIKKIEDGFNTVSEQYEAVHLRAALSEAMALATEVNKYLDTNAPWHLIKTDKNAAGRAMFVAIKAIDSIKILLSPILPFTCEELHRFLGYDESIFGEQSVDVVKDDLGEHKVLKYIPDKATGKWAPSKLESGQKLKAPAPLFKKLDLKIVEEERSRLRN